MPYNRPLITFAPSQQAKADDVNSNFLALNLGTMQSLSSDNGAISSDGIGNLLTAGTLGVSVSGDVLDGSDPANTYLISYDASGGFINLQTPNGASQVVISQAGVQMYQPLDVMNFYEGSIGRVSRFSGNGSGTYTHAMRIAPLWVCPTCTVVNASDGYGFDTVGNTSVHITTLNGLAFLAWCLR